MDTLLRLSRTVVSGICSYPSDSGQETGIELTQWPISNIVSYKKHVSSHTDPKLQIPDYESGSELPPVGV